MPETCEWTTFCERPSEVQVEHPTRGVLMVCGECAAKLNPGEYNRGPSGTTEADPQETP